MTRTAPFESSTIDVVKFMVDVALSVTLLATHNTCTVIEKISSRAHASRTAFGSTE